MKPLVDTRKLFTITTVYDENFLFPGSSLPGPEAPRLTVAKTIGEKEYPVGDFDPEWVKPDTENIYLGELEGRFYYSIRADIDSSIETLGDIGDEVDPQTLDTVTAELYAKLAELPAVIAIRKELGLGNKEEMYKALFPNATALQTALANNPEVVTEFLQQQDEDEAQFLAKLGIVKE
jgi:hypothetical protein